MAPYGYQWFSVQDRTPTSVLAGVRAAAPSLDAFIDEELQKRDLTDGDAALVGFSQGTMMSLFVGLRRAAPLAGILGYSGRLIAPELLASELRSRPPVLLVHGTEDPLVPFDSMASAEAALRQAGVPVETLACPGIEHAIDPEGLERGGRFLRDVLSGSARSGASLPEPRPPFTSGSSTASIVAESHSAAPSTRPTSRPSASSTMLVGSPRTPNALPTSLFGSR